MTLVVIPFHWVCSPISVVTQATGWTTGVAFPAG